MRTLLFGFRATGKRKIKVFSRGGGSQNHFEHPIGALPVTVFIWPSPSLVVPCELRPDKKGKNDVDQFQVSRVARVGASRRLLDFANSFVNRSSRAEKVKTIRCQPPRLNTLISKRGRAGATSTFFGVWLVQSRAAFDLLFRRRGCEPDVFGERLAQSKAREEQREDREQTNPRPHFRPTPNHVRGKAKAVGAE